MTGASPVLYLVFVVIICAEAVTTSLTLYRAYGHFRHGRNVLVQSLTYDGVFYCVCMFTLSVVNVIVIFLLPAQSSEVLTTYQAVIHTILASRMQIHLRKLHRFPHLANPFLDGSGLPMGSFKQVDPLYA